MENFDTGRALDRAVAGCAAAHQQLLAALDELTDLQVRQPSLLPGWSVGHVVTHLARNGDSHVRMFEGAERGEVVRQYASNEGRAAEIEAGSSRPASELVGDLRTSIWRLEGAWASASAEAWTGSGSGTDGTPLPIVTLPFRRWRETVVHHSDLGLGYTPDQWPSEYVRLDLAVLEALWTSRRATEGADLARAASELDERTRLQWLLGRAVVDGLPAAGIL